MIDWARKLTSRKFLAAVGTFVTGLIIACGGTQEVATQVVALIMSGGAVIAYIVSEGKVDAAGAANAASYVPYDADDPPDSIDDRDEDDLK